MAKKRIIIKQPNFAQNQFIKSTAYNADLSMSFGTVVAHNKDIGAIDIKLASGFIAKNIFLLSEYWPLEEIGGIAYPPLGSNVRIIHPKGDIKNGFPIPASLNYRNDTVKTEFLDPGTDIKSLPGGWKIDYDQETGNYSITNGDFSLTIDNDGTVISLVDWNGNTVNFVDGAIEIQGNADNAVAFNDLKTGFDQLKTDFNNLVSTFNTHVHTGVTTGPGSSGPPPTPGVSSTASIDNSKIENIKVP